MSEFLAPLPLYAIVLLAFTAESMTGFGATVITVTLGAQLLPLDQLLPLYVPANFVLSTWMVASMHPQIDRPWLVGQLLPRVGVGMAVGLAIFRWAPPGPGLLIGYAALVLTLAALELARMAKKGSDHLEIADAEPLQPRVSRASAAALLAGGLVHGIYGSGGPLMVWASSQRLNEKAKLRATLAATWTILSVVLLIQYASMGLLGPRSLIASASLLPAVALARWIGDHLHDRVSEHTFRRLVYLLLFAAAASLLLRTLWKLLSSPPA